MTVLTEQCSKTYSGDGVNDTFPTTFRFLDNADLTVTLISDALISTVQVLDVHYKLSGAGLPDPGGTVTFLLAPPPNDYTVVIERNTPILQEVALRADGRYLPATIMEMFDRLTMIAQEAERDIDALAAVTTPAVISAGSLVFTDKTFLTNANDVESNFPMNVAVASGSTATGCWAVRLRNLDDSAEVFDEPPAIQWGPGVGSNVSLKFVAGLKPATNYTLRIATVIP